MERGVLFRLAVVWTMVSVTVVAGGQGSSSVLLDMNGETFDGADTLILTLEPSEDVTVKDGSVIQVDGGFTPSSLATGVTIISNGGSPSVGTAGDARVGSDLPKQAGSFTAIARDGWDVSCDTCTVRLHGVSMKDLASGGQGPLTSLTHAEASFRGPVTLEESLSETPSGWSGLRVLIQWFADADLEKGQEYNIMVTIPEADWLEVDADVRIQGDASDVDVTTETHDGGFIFAGDDFEPTARADTAVASATIDGEATVTTDTTETIYGGITASWYGYSTVTFPSVGFGAGLAIPHNTAAVGHYGVELPNGNTFGQDRIVLGGASGPIVLGHDDPGDYRFFVDHQVGVGPQDMYAIGFVNDA